MSTRPATEPDRTAVRRWAEREMVRSPTSVLRLLVGICVLGTGLLVAWRFSNTMTAASADWQAIAHVLPAWIRAIPGVLVALVLVVVPVVANVQLVRYRRIRLLVVVNLAALASFVLSEVVLDAVTRNPPSMFPTVHVELGGAGNDPLLAAFVAALIVGIPYVPRSVRRLATATIALSLVASLVFSDLPALAWLLDVGVGMTCGAAAALLFGTPDAAPGRAEIVDRLERSGIAVASLERANVDARGSTPWIGTAADGGGLFVKVLDGDNRSADLMFRAARAALLRSSGDQRPMSSLRRSVEHEALLSLRATASGISTPELLTVTDIGDDAMLLAFEAVDGRSLDRLTPDLVTDAVLDEVWRQVVVLRSHGIAHRDLRLANVFAGSDGTVYLIDFGFAELAASPLLLATDLAELLASTATVVGVGRAVDAAERAVGEEGLAIAHARLQPGALGGATRAALKESGELDALRGAVALRAGIPAVDYEGRVPGSSWPALAWFVFAALVVGGAARAATASGPLAGIVQVDQVAWTVAAATVGVLAACLASVGSMRDALGIRSAVSMRLAADHAELLRPMHTADVAVRVRSLLGRGVGPNDALGAVGLAVVARGVTHVAVTYLAVRLSGRDGSIDVVVEPDPVWIAVGCLVVAGLAAVSLLGPVRRRVVSDVVAPIRRAPDALRSLTGHATRLAQLLVGSMLVPLSAVAGLVAADRAVGGTLDPPSIAVTVLVVTLVAALLPLPGGAGVTEAALIAGLVLLGERSGAAVPAVALFRLTCTWLPAAIGWWAMRPLARGPARRAEEVRR